MAQITVRYEGLGDPARLAALGRDLPRAITRALNRTGQGILTGTVRAIAADTGLRQTDIRPHVRLVRATFTRQEITVRVGGRRIPLLAFGARQTRRGVAYRLRGGRGVVPSAFLATMRRSGHHGVFKRAGPSRSRAGKPRGAPGLPITELFGPSLPGVVRNRRIFETLAPREALLRSLDHEVRFLLRGRGLAPGGADAA